jgi:hypothetical protein
MGLANSVWHAPVDREAHQPPTGPEGWINCSAAFGGRRQGEREKSGELFMLKLVNIAELDRLESTLQNSKLINRVLTDYLLDSNATSKEEEESIRERLIQISMEKVLKKTGCFLPNKGGMNQ